MNTRGAKDRIEQEGVSFFESIRNTYLQLAEQQPERFCVINANQPEAEVVADALQSLQARAGGWW